MFLFFNVKLQLILVLKKSLDQTKYMLLYLAYGSLVFDIWLEAYNFFLENSFMRSRGQQILIESRFWTISQAQSFFFFKLR